jgi:hypothetical protein
LPLFFGDGSQSPCADAARTTGVATPQYGHTSTKSARFPRQLRHSFKASPPGCRYQLSAWILRRECIWKCQVRLSRSSPPGAYLNSIDCSADVRIRIFCSISRPAIVKARGGGRQ